ncbi:ead/Ea22-like family protein [Escherichia coli]|uniref:ead/Ea22-like family protein n=1 Tax=Escherichia coli TaxID=562 RepID=UPI001FF4C359|nr:ead/Ea22-like family protein [Escherichia coli]MCJ8627347.1 ead/Ea22-like family protein [Escherichia coli]
MFCRFDLFCYPATVLALLDELEAKDQRIAVLTESLKQTVSGYKSCLRTGHERILDLGGDCDAPKVMIAGNPDIQQAQKLIAAASGKGEAS